MEWRCLQCLCLSRLDCLGTRNGLQCDVIRSHITGEPLSYNQEMASVEEEEEEDDTTDDDSEEDSDEDDASGSGSDDSEEDGEEEADSDLDE